MIRKSTSTESEIIFSRYRKLSYPPRLIVPQLSRLLFFVFASGAPEVRTSEEAAEPYNRKETLYGRYRSLLHQHMTV